MDRQANIEKSIAYLAADEQVRCRIPSSPGERQRLLRALMNVWEPKELPEEFLAMQDAELQAQAAEPSIAPFSERVEQLRRLVRFNRDYPQPYQAGIERFIPFTEDINHIISQLNIST